MCNFFVRRKRKRIRKFCEIYKSLKKLWRRRQESNLHALTGDGFQDRCTTIMRLLRKFAAN